MLRLRYMETLISLLILIVIVVVAIWLINQIPFPAGLEIIKTVLVIIVVVLALQKLFGYW